MKSSSIIKQDNELGHSIFQGLELDKPVEVYALNADFQEDTHPKKVDLTIGEYKTDKGGSYVLPVVRKVEQSLAHDETLTHNYQPMEGYTPFSKAATSLLLGPDNEAVTSGRAFSIQTLSGTGALRLGAEFITKTLKRTIFYYPLPTWSNHGQIFMAAGAELVRGYRYWCSHRHELDAVGLLADLHSAPRGSVIQLQACAHCPTGTDPDRALWEAIADAIQEQDLLPFFDCTNVGLASGEVETDAWPVRYFVKRGFELICAQSFSKTFCLYDERVGNLVMVSQYPEALRPAMSQLTRWARGLYGQPAAHGARIVAIILNNPNLYDQWTRCLKMMTTRIQEMRQTLYTELLALNTPGEWGHIVKQTGMYAFTGLSVRQVGHLNECFHIYMPKTGRLSISGLTLNNVKYVAGAIHQAVLNFPTAPLKN